MLETHKTFAESLKSTKDTLMQTGLLLETEKAKLKTESFRWKIAAKTACPYDDLRYKAMEQEYAETLKGIDTLIARDQSLTDDLLSLEKGIRNHDLDAIDATDKYSHIVKGYKKISKEIKILKLKEQELHQKMLKKIKE